MPKDVQKDYILALRYDNVMKKRRELKTLLWLVVLFIVSIIVHSAVHKFFKIEEPFFFLLALLFALAFAFVLLYIVIRFIIKRIRKRVR